MVRTTDANGATTTSVYDPLGRQVSTTNPVSGTMLMTYTATEAVATQDMAGNVTRQSYDGAGRLVQASDALTGMTTYGYDPVGNTVAVTAGDTAGNVTQLDTRHYDALNRVMTDTVSGPSSPPLTTATYYDADGNVAQVLQPNGDTTVNSYDVLDRPTDTEIDTAVVGAPTKQTVESWTYDAAGNVASVIDFDGRVHQPQNDADNRLVQQTDYSARTATLTTTLSDDPAGNTLREVRQGPGVGGGVQTQTITNTYNAADWETATSDDGLTTRYGYDAAGQQRSHTILNGNTAVTSVLDAEGRTTSIAETMGGTGPYPSTVGYNGNDLVTSVGLPGGVGEQAAYDPDSRLTHVGLSGPTTGSNAPTLNSGYDYGYNAVGWTTGMTWTVNGAVTTTQIAHDSQGRVTRWSGQPNGPETWSYDGNGNIVTNTEYLEGMQRTSVYTYSPSVPNEQLQGHTDGLGVEYRTYDQTGDTTSITSTDALTKPDGSPNPYHVAMSLWYDSQARPITVTGLQGGVPLSVTMGYNAAGQRARYTVALSGTVINDERFQYRDGDLAQMTALTATLNGDGSVKSTGAYTDTYVYGVNNAPLELLRQQGSATTRYWYVLDGRGNVVALTDVNGVVVDRYAYDPWGEGIPEGMSETVPQPLRYAGYWWDKELGWYWVSVRSYDPEGRWLQPDPSQQDGVRTYVYVDDDPVDATDPTGLARLAGGNDPCIIERDDPSWTYYQWRCWQKHGHAHWRNPYHLPLAAGAILVRRRFGASGIDTKQFKNLYAPSKKASFGKGQYGEYVQDRFYGRFGYERVGGHPWQSSSKGGPDGIYRKVAEVPGNQNLPRWIVSDGKQGSYYDEYVIRMHDGAYTDKFLDDLVGKDMATAMRTDGYAIVRTHAYFTGPESDPGVSADVEVVQDHVVLGASGDFPATDIIDGAAGADAADE